MQPVIFYSVFHNTFDKQFLKFVSNSPRGNSEVKKGVNNTQLAHTADVNVYIEYCKKLKPSIYSSESLYEQSCPLCWQWFVSVDVALSLFVMALSLLTSFQ